MEFEWRLIKKPLLGWYRKNHRDLIWRKTKNPYYIWLSEIMLQQTRVEAVVGYYQRFLKEVPDVNSLATLSEERLMKLWEGLGYYNRARNLQKAAKIIVNDYNNAFPDVYEDVLNLPGIGEYTASAICSICYNQCTPAVDGNVLRVVMRILNCYDNIDNAATKKKVRNWLIPLYSDGDCGELTQAIMELGAMVCIPNGIPKCDQCPISSFCKASQLLTYSDLPVRKIKKKRKIINMTVFVLHNDSSYGIRKRSDKGLLANLWEFYNIDQQMDAQTALDFIASKGYGPVHLERQIPYVHVFSHVEWHMTAYYIACNQKNDKLTWIDKSCLREDYALPTAFRVFIEKDEG